MTNFGCWNRLLSIKGPIYWEVTPKLLTSFEVDRSPVGYAKAGDDPIPASRLAPVPQLHPILAIAKIIQPPRNTRIW